MTDSQNFGPYGLKNVAKYRVSKKLKSRFQSFRVTYSFRSLTNPYIPRRNCYPISIGHLGFLKLPNPKILGFKGCKMYEQGSNIGFQRG